MPLLWGGKMNEDIIAIIEKQGNYLATKEFKSVVRDICIKSGDIATNTEEFSLCCCWYAMQYGRIAGVREERRKKKKAAQRCNAERQAEKPTTV